ncbi:MAG: 4-alpha-glucanotransferase, partial [Verrucomicrobiota bacterium]
MSNSESESSVRIAGVLVPVFAIRTESDLGIGDTSGVKQMIDWLAGIGMRFLQVLPINEMAGDNSPYNAISSVAIEPSTLDVSPDTIPELQEEDYQRILAGIDLADLRTGPVDYDKVKRLKSDLLWSAFRKFQTDPAVRGSQREKDFLQFCQRESGWLKDYCTFRVFMDMEGGSENWENWSERYNTIDKARAHLQNLLSNAPDQARMQQAYYAYVQFLAHQQWKEVSRYAAEKDVKLMGDVPFGLSRCSADVFSEPEWFDLEWCGGAPPETNFKDDDFVVRWGQNWGIPHYRWDRMAADGFQWW